jgi:hypothetical protein
MADTGAVENDGQSRRRSRWDSESKTLVAKAEPPKNGHEQGALPGSDPVARALADQNAATRRFLELDAQHRAAVEKATALAKERGEAEKAMLEADRKLQEGLSRLRGEGPKQPIVRRRRRKGVEIPPAEGAEAPSLPAAVGQMPGEGYDSA